MKETMKAHVNVTLEGIVVNEMFEGTSADEVVGKMKARVARELPFAMKMVVNSMSNLMFTQEVVRRYNDFKKLTLPLPNSCEAFLTLAQEQGLAMLS
jgi:hypothetical protein